MPNFHQLAQSLVDGLLLGVVYAVAAMGLTLIFGVMRVVNLAHGSFITAGMFGLFVVVHSLGLNVYVGVAIAAGGGLLLGLVVYWIAVRRLLDSPELTTLLSTFAVSIMLIGAGTATFSTTPRNIPLHLGFLGVGSVRLSKVHLVAVAISLALIAALYLLLYRSPVGRKIRAVADNRAAAELVGIPSSRVLAQTFALGTMLAVAAGALIATLFPFTVLSGSSYELKSFVIVVLGGLGNVTGALLGGLMIGVVEGLVPVFTSVGWAPLVEFGMFVLVLLVRPQGLMGNTD